MNDFLYVTIRRIFDIIILLLFVLILIPDNWLSKSKEDQVYSSYADKVKLNDEAKSVEKVEEPKEVVVDNKENPVNDLQYGVVEINKENNVFAQIIDAEVPMIEENDIIEIGNTNLSDNMNIVNKKITKNENITKEPKEEIKKNEIKKEDKKKEIEKKEVKYWLQIGVFRDHAASDEFVKKIAKYNLSYRVESLGSLYVVKVGPLSNDADINKMIDKIKQANIKSWVKIKG